MGKDFFISYTAADRAWAEWIAWQLEGAGYDVVLQAWDVAPRTALELVDDAFPFDPNDVGTWGRAAPRLLAGNTGCTRSTAVDPSSSPAHTLSLG